MIARLEQLHARFDERLERMLGEIRAMSTAQRRFKPDEPTWSPAQVSHHLLLAQTGIVGQLEKKRGEKAKSRTLAQRFRHAAVSMVLRSSIKVKNPAPSAAPDASVTFDEMGPQWASERERFRSLLDSMDESALGDAGFRHPVSGPLSVEETVAFMGDHIDHHLRQLRRIRAHPDFPA